MDLAVEKNELHCPGTTISAFFGREPGRTWAKNGFVRFLVQTGDKRNHRLPDTPTMWELMDQEKATDATKRLARVVLGPGAFGRPILAPLAAALVQMAISRTREYSADREGARISGDPLSLAPELRRVVTASVTLGLATGVFAIDLDVPKQDGDADGLRAWLSPPALSSR